MGSHALASPAAELRRRFGRAVECERRAAGLTQVQLAAQVDSSQAAISRLERGEVFSLELASRTAEAFGRSVDDLIRSTEEVG